VNLNPPHRLDTDGQPVLVKRESIEADLLEIVLAFREQDEVRVEREALHAQVELLLVGAPARRGRRQHLDRPPALAQESLEPSAERLFLLDPPSERRGVSEEQDPPRVRRLGTSALRSPSADAFTATVTEIPVGVPDPDSGAEGEAEPSVGPLGIEGKTLVACSGAAPRRHQAKHGLDEPERDGERAHDQDETTHPAVHGQAPPTRGHGSPGRTWPGRSAPAGPDIVTRSPRRAPSARECDLLLGRLGQGGGPALYLVGGHVLLVRGDVPVVTERILYAA
jgi:hypothetical protein